MIKRALLSVSDKSGIVEFARSLVTLEVEILSTGGTAKLLRDSGLPVTDVSDFTGFPEMLDGRVKTLHPKVHAGLLFKRDHPEHEAAMRERGYAPIDLVCVNLYPFERVSSKPGVTFEEAMENIDIGGPTLLRAAAKNLDSVTVVTDPADYARVLSDLNERSGTTSGSLRLHLARKAFVRLAVYNAAIADYLQRVSADEQPPSLVQAYATGSPLRYGENPHQSAVLFTDAPPTEATIAHAEPLHGKALSYNNYVDGDAALEAVRELAGQPAVAIVKHTNPCGYATGHTLAEAFRAAWAGDPVSAFGGVVAVTTTVDEETATLTKGRFIEAIIAPGYEPGALSYLKEKSADLRLLKLHRDLHLPRTNRVIRQISGGLLAQEKDVGTAAQFVCPTENAFPSQVQPLAEFGIKACKHVKSNAIVLVREYLPGRYAVLGIGAGQPNRVDAVRKLALTKARENITLLYRESGEYGQLLKDFEHRMLSECVLVSDAFFPFADSIEHAAEAGIRYIVQPGGSKRDEEVIAACDQYGIAMAFTGMRHFRH